MTTCPDATSSGYTTDFFVSHADADVEWAEWIAYELEAAGYGVVVKAWDFRAGENLLSKIDEALTTCRHTIAIISSSYVSTEIAGRTAAQYQGLDGKKRALIPVRVDNCEIPPSLGPIIAVDLCDVDEDDARNRLRTGVAGRAHRAGRGGFPAKRQKQARFPLAETAVWELRGHRPDPNFTGRDDTLAALHRSFRAGRPTSAVQALTGLWGLGKTRLAIEYANRHAAAYDVVWWVRAEHQATLHGDYAELARALGLPFDQDSQAIAAVRQRLRQLKHWLIIFDNAEDPEELFSLLPDRHAGHVLITSQRREWPQAEVWPLKALPPEIATEYLIARGKVADSRVAREVAEVLGGLPLALAQAASVIAEGVGASEYLNELRKESPELFDQGNPADYRRTVVSTWRVSFARLSKESSTAADLFRLGAFFAAESIPLASLRSAHALSAELMNILTDPFKRRGATRALAEYSLAETADGLLSIHRLVQAVTRAELGEDEPRWAGLAMGVIVASFPENVGNPSSWPACEALLSHAIACAEHGGRLHVDVVTTCTLQNRVARYLLERGRLERAVVILDQTLTRAEQFIREDSVFYDCRNTQGLLLLARGDFKAALAVQEEVYEARGRILGPDDIKTLRAGCDLTEMLFIQGQWTRAQALQDHLVKRFSTVMGTDNLETIKAIAYQATLVRAAGGYCRALELEEQVLDARRRILGDDHPDTLTAKSNLAATLEKQGKLNDAQELEEEVLESRRSLLGDEHPDTLGAMGNLAITLFQRGALVRARTLEKEVLKSRQRLLGDEHPDTLNAMINLAATMRMQGELDGAQELQERALDISGRLLGDEHPRTVNALASLAMTLFGQGEVHDARRMAKQVLDVRRHLLGDEHPDTLRAMIDLATTLRVLDDLDNCLALIEQALDSYRNLFGNEHLDTLEAMSALAETLRAAGDLVAARALAEEVLETYRRLLGNEHLETVQASLELAIILHEDGAKDLASSLLSEAMETCRRVFGKKNTMTSQIAWQLLAIHDGPHEAAKRRILAMHLSWLGREAEIHLTAQQKQILDALRKSGYGSGGGAARGPKRRH